MSKMGQEFQRQIESGFSVGSLQRRVVHLEAINEQHRILNGELRQRIKELEAQQEREAKK